MSTTAGAIAAADFLEDLAERTAARLELADAWRRRLDDTEMALSIAGAAVGLLTGLLIGPASTARAGDPDFLTLSVGGFDVNDNETSAEFRIEYRSSRKYLFLKPMIGLLGNSEGGIYGYGGVNLDIYFGRRWVVMPNFAIGGYRRGGSKDLGSVIEFRSGLEIAYRFDDHSRLGFADVMPDERKESAVAFLKAAVAWYARLGVTVERVMTDNGSCYRSRAFDKACRALRLRHIFTRPYTPRTNGKAERFIQSSLREWAYARAYENSDQRTGELQHWMHHYNWHRPHAGIKGKIPISRLGLDVNNLLRLHI
ncbi:MAG: transposase family protein [Proteobacteria bacterium]|nr:transposase family protein [Pseudomonadota bacterium]